MKKEYCFKKLCASLLCMIMCLSLCAGAFAEDYVAVDKIDVEKISYYSVSGIEPETETLLENSVISAAGTYRIKADVKNYGTSVDVDAVLIAGAFVKETHELVAVAFDKESVAKVVDIPETVTLSTDILLDEEDVEKDIELKGYVIKSLSTLMPQGNEPPAAPTDVTVDETTITNSTVDITWTASIDDANAIAYYNVYRDGEYVGSTFGNVTEFKDVGIDHNTTVSYTVSAVDAAGAEGEKSETSVAVKTDSIARLWLGAAASEIAEGETSATLAATDYSKIANENITPHYFILGDDTNESTIEAVGEEYEFNTNQKLGLSAMKFGQNMARVLATIPDGDFLDGLKTDANKEMKIIMNTYDYYAGTPSYVTNIGRNAAALVRYSHSSSLAGASGAVYATTNKWNTTTLTLPLTGNSGTYSDVFSNRAFALSPISSAGKAVQHTDGQSTMFSIGNGTTNLPVYIQKVDFAASDYVPYGAVLDFENQGDSQFVYFIRRNGYNLSEITEMTASSDSVSKKAYILDAASGSKLYLGLDEDYIDASDNDLIVKVTYLDNKEDATNAEGLQLIYKKVGGGTVGTNYIKREGTGEWKTAQFILNDAALNTAWDALVLSVPSATGDDAFCVSRVEVINRKPAN